MGQDELRLNERASYVAKLFKRYDEVMEECGRCAKFYGDKIYNGASSGDVYLFSRDYPKDYSGSEFELYDKKFQEFIKFVADTKKKFVEIYRSANIELLNKLQSDLFDKIKEINGYAYANSDYRRRFIESFTSVNDYIVQLEEQLKK